MLTNIEALFFLFWSLFCCFFFWCGPFLKSLLNLLQYCFCLMFWVFGSEACWILAPWQGIEPRLPALEREVLTTGPPGKSFEVHFLTVLLTETKKKKWSVPRVSRWTEREAFSYTALKSVKFLESNWVKY